MPKIDLQQTYENADGTVAIDPRTKAPMILKDILIMGLLNDDQRNPLSAKEKADRYSLYRDIKKSKVGYVLLDAEDVVLLKKAVEVLPTLTLGQTHEMLEREYAPPVEPTP